MLEPELNHDFLDAGVDLHALNNISFDARGTVLDRLGPAHFRSKGFSFMGFLQTVYDHVAQHTTQTPISTSPEIATDYVSTSGALGSEDDDITTDSVDLELHTPPDQPETPDDF
ncbi:MAG: hypothetical protein H7144_02000 [Burkholderiales bacterium]|nr:hypothetical protein [Phycisphaerae bacterium]